MPPKIVRRLHESLLVLSSVLLLLFVVVVVVVALEVVVVVVLPPKVVRPRPPQVLKSLEDVLQHGQAYLYL